MASVHKEEQDTLSEAVQMYLVALARLGEDGSPVPLSKLAKELAISPVSANEMCRKLQEQKLIVYQPYKGAWLTSEGERRANYVLRRHRLWEVLLVDKLNLDFDQAHDMACQLEHATSDMLADRLDWFLGYPAVNPLGQPIPQADGSAAEHTQLLLADLTAGRHGHVLCSRTDEAVWTFLQERGLRPGCSVMVLASAPDAVLVKVGEQVLSLARRLAEQIWIEPDAEGEAE